MIFPTQRYPCTCDDGYTDRYTSQHGSEVSHHGTVCQQCDGKGYLELDIESAMARGLVSRNDAAEIMYHLEYEPEEIEQQLLMNGLMLERRNVA